MNPLQLCNTLALSAFSLHALRRLEQVVNIAKARYLNADSTQDLLETNNLWSSYVSQVLSSSCISNEGVTHSKIQIITGRQIVREDIQAYLDIIKQSPCDAEISDIIHRRDLTPCLDSHGISKPRIVPVEDEGGWAFAVLYADAVHWYDSKPGYPAPDHASTTWTGPKSSKLEDSGVFMLLGIRRIASLQPHIDTDNIDTFRTHLFVELVAEQLDPPDEIVDRLLRASMEEESMFFNDAFDEDTAAGMVETSQSYWPSADGMQPEPITTVPSPAPDSTNGVVNEPVMDTLTIGSPVRASANAARQPDVHIEELISLPQVVITPRVTLTEAPRPGEADSEDNSQGARLPIEEDIQMSQGEENHSPTSSPSQGHANVGRQRSPTPRANFDSLLSDSEGFELRRHILQSLSDAVAVVRCANLDPRTNFEVKQSLSYKLKVGGDFHIRWCKALYASDLANRPQGSANKRHQEQCQYWKKLRDWGDSRQLPGLLLFCVIPKRVQMTGRLLKRFLDWAESNTDELREHLEMAEDVYNFIVTGQLPTERMRIESYEERKEEKVSKPMFETFLHFGGGGVDDSMSPA